MAQQLGNGREYGFPVCQVDGAIVKGPASVGHKYGVQIETRCSQGSLIAIHHTHPGTDNIEPSAADIREAHRLKVPVCIEIPETGEIRCYQAVSPTKCVDLSRRGMRR